MPPVNWNEVKALLEAQDRKITTIAEGMADIHPRIVRVETKVDALGEDVKDLKGWLHAFDKRLTVVEAK